jgi:hypothetical protein
MFKLSSLPNNSIQEASISCTDEQLVLIEFAVKTVKKVGFELLCSSMKSEACYYRLGDRRGTLRIAAHRFSHRSEGQLLSFPVWSCLTFNKPVYKTIASVLSDIDYAVGRYFMYPHTKLSEIRGKFTQPIEHLFPSDTISN